MAHVGIRRVLVVFPLGHTPSGKSLVPDLDIQVEQTTPEAAACPSALAAAQGRFCPPPLLATSPHQRGPTARRPRRANQQRQPRQQRSVSLRAGALPSDALTSDLWSWLAARPHRREDIAPHLWQRVIDKRSARAAKNMLFDQVSKATSGTVARLLNVRISVPISKLIVDTGISPNMVTFFMVLCPGLFAAYLATPTRRLPAARMRWCPLAARLHPRRLRR